MTKPIQGKKFLEFRDRTMGMSNGKNIAEVRKVRDEIAQNEDLQNGQTARGLKSKNSNRKVTGLCQHDPNPKECVGKVKIM